MSKVYRLEYNDQGIYAGSGWWFEHIEVFVRKKHPLAWDDHKLVEAFEKSRFKGNFTRPSEDKFEDLHDLVRRSEDCAYLFGFNSPTQLKRWVFKKSWRQKMLEGGVKMKVYEVPPKSRLLGMSQVIFKASDAVLVDVLDIPV